MSKSETALVVATIGASATFIVSVLGLVAAHLSNKRERRRQLYSEALRAILRWKEQLYRVRRRAKGTEVDLVAQFHQLQDDLTYYQAWIGSESAYMKRSYDRLVEAVKSGTEQLITSAWNDPVRPLPGNAKKSDEHPNFDVSTSRFLRDIRSHLSPWPNRKLAVRFRNREKDWKTRKYE